MSFPPGTLLVHKTIGAAFIEAISNSVAIPKPSPHRRFVMQDGSEFVVSDDQMIQTTQRCHTQASLLVPGERLLTVTHDYQGMLSESAAYIKGFLLGDGTLTVNGDPLLWLYEPKYCCGERLSASAAEVTSAILEFDAVADAERPRKRLNGIGQLTPLVHWASDYKKQLPSRAFSWNRKTLCEFLAGVFDSDGHSQDGKTAFGYQLSSIHRQFLLDIQLLLKSMGVRSKVAMAQMAQKKQLPNGVYDCQDLWRLTVPQSGSIRLAQLVKFTRLKDFSARTVSRIPTDNAGLISEVHPVDHLCPSYDVPSSEPILLANQVVIRPDPHPTPPVYYCF